MNTFETIYILNTCDHFHSHNSFEQVGLFDCKEKLINEVRKHLQKTYTKDDVLDLQYKTKRDFINDAIHSLITINQTQTLPDYEFNIETIEQSDITNKINL